MAKIWLEIKYQRPYYRSNKGSKWWTLGQDWGSLARYRPNLGNFAWIWAIVLEFEPFCLDLGHIAWILAIWQNLGPNRSQRSQSPEDRAGGTDGRTDVHTDRQIPPVFYRTLSPLGPLPKNDVKK